MKEYALIVAGGTGSRMSSTLPKQFIKIDGLPVLMHTINAFVSYSKSIEVIVVLPNHQFDPWNRLIQEYNFTRTHQLVSGGPTRFNSVFNGLQAMDGDGVVAIHDGVRPFVSVEIIERCFRSAKTKGCGVAAVTPKDSLREITSGGSTAVIRENYRVVQTPQTFILSKIKQAYLLATHNNFSDDAAVAELAGETIHMVEGEYRNIKITTPEDLLIAQALIKK